MIARALVAVLLSLLPAAAMAQQIVVGDTEFSIRQLRQELTQKTIRTVTTWTGTKIQEFSGPRLVDILAVAGIDPSANVKAMAENEYSVLILRADIDKYDPIIAISQFGKPLTFQNKGPARLVWPRSEFDDFTIAKDGYWIWYLTVMEPAH